MPRHTVVRVSLFAALSVAACAAQPATNGPPDDPQGSLDAGTTATKDAATNSRDAKTGTAGAGGTGGSGGSDEVDAAPPASDDAAPSSTSDAGAANDGATGADGASMPVGVRTSLRDDLAARWMGERRTMTNEGGTTIFTGVFEANKFGGPQGHNVRLKVSPGREYVFEYRIRFDGDFPWTKGGKIPGLAGGTAPTGCVTTTGGGFSARMMWREGGKLIGYTYDNDQGGDCGNAIATSFTFAANKWHSVKERVRINTGRNHDGILQVWIDDRMVINRANMAFMNEAPGSRIDQVLFHSFFGGSTQGWAPTRQCSMSFSDPYVTKVGE